ncbi:methyltransferase domain-containing protein [Aestuariivirga sp.]|uniref:class I SAM-dependent methyltransferase n=1 Tax=Aestuariivirga sp. TaxID=2650926 RepID=UPI0025B86550|nr:methyltransferase domain-containing protein [Aestuariivirga sp.]MCA3554993.1 methyltransferase domain-containing protein [Aestuariivirga sp.]
MTGAPPLFDRALSAARAARKRAGEPNILTRTIAEELAERLAFVNRRFGRVLLIAAEPGAIAARLKQGGQVTEVETRGPSAGDHLELPETRYDAVFSVLDLQTFNDVPGALIQMRRALRPDGLLLACLFAGDTLTELRQSWLAAEASLSGGVSPRVAPMIDVRELGALLQRAGLSLPVADLDRTMVRHADAIALIHDIRALGLSNNLVGRSRRPVSRRLMGAAVNHYQRNFADPDGRVRATVEVAWLTGWAPHESQQQPLKPGSARARLADALRVEEKKL